MFVGNESIAGFDDEMAEAIAERHFGKSSILS